VAVAAASADGAAFRAYYNQSIG